MTIFAFRAKNKQKLSDYYFSDQITTKISSKNNKKSKDMAKK